MNELLDTILRPGGLSVVFQPIFAERLGTRSVHALECLTRGPLGTKMESANVLFEYVRLKREESLVDRACVAAALRAARLLPGSARLALNVHASTLGRDREFVAHLKGIAEESSMPLSRLIVEIVEHTPFWDGRSFREALAGLRREGVQIALDDVGLGHSNHRMILECLPDYLKVDRYLVSGCHLDVHRRVILESLQRLACNLGAQVVAEGVEAQAELETVRELGIELVQGYLLSRPVARQGLEALLAEQGNRTDTAETRADPRSPAQDRPAETIRPAPWR